MSLVYITAKQDAWLFNFGCVAEILRQRASICEMWSVFVCWLESEEKRERETFKLGCWCDWGYWLISYDGKS